MSNLDKEILSSFLKESKTLVLRAVEVLEEVESDLSEASQLKDYGNLVDRIMGGSQSLSLQLVKYKPLIFVGDVAALCKAVAYKASSTAKNTALIEICVALLLDATDVLKDVLEDLNKEELATNQNYFELKGRFSQHFVERLRWASSQFHADVKGTVSSKSAGVKDGDSEIDALLKKLGM